MSNIVPIGQSYSHVLPEFAEKSIWGPTWQAFMGMPTDTSGVNPIGNQPSDYSRAVEAESYVFRCEDVRGKAISQVPLKAWEKGRDGMLRSIEHPALEVLAQTNPYGYVDGTALMRYTLGSLDLHGRCAWRLAFNKKKIPSEIYWVVPTTFSPLPDPVKFFRGIRLNTENGVKEIPPSQLCYFATDNFSDPLIGTSKIGVLQNAINLRQYSAHSNIDFFANSMRPDLVVTGDWNNTNDNVQRLRREWRQAFSGETNRSPFFAGNNTKAQLLTQTAKDMEWLAQQRLSQEEISSVFGVPLIYLNNFDRATYDNIKTAKLILWHDTMIPEGDGLARMFTKQFLWRFWPDTFDRKIILRFDFADIDGLGEDLALIWERVQKMSVQISEQVKNRELTPAQARELRTQLFTKLGIDTTAFNDTIPGGSTFYLQFGEIPIDQASVQAIMNIEAARSSSPLAAELVENVPGAPNARPNAQRIVAQNQQQLDQAHEDRMAAVTARSQPAAKELTTKSFTNKGPNPIPIRTARLDPVQAKMTRRLKKHFQGLKNQAEKKLRGDTQYLSATSKEFPIDPNMNLYDTDQAQNDLIDIWNESVSMSAVVAYQSATEDFSLKVVYSEDNPWLPAYMGMRLPLIRGIDDNLRDRLRKAMTDSAQAGETIPQIAEAVRGEFQAAIESRAELIARTETIQAYGYASLEAYRQAGIAEAQMYDGLNADSADCITVNGMVVPLSEAQTLMGMEHPNGTRGVAPVVNRPILQSAPHENAESIGPGFSLVRGGHYETKGVQEGDGLQVHVHLDKGMVQNTIAEGAISVVHQPPGQDSEFEYDDRGRVARVKRH